MRFTASLVLLIGCEGGKSPGTGETSTHTGGESGRESGQETGRETGEPAPSGCTPRDEGYVTDAEVYPVPETPALDAAGDTVVDPTFGTPVLRVTDASHDPTGCVHSYSYWPAMNVDSTRMVLYCNADGLRLYSFDPEALAAESLGVLFASNPEGGSTPSWGDVFWSGSDPDRLYLHDGARLYAYDVSTSTYSLVRDLSETLGTQKVLKQMSMSQDDDVFAWYLQDYASALQGYLVYQASTDTILAFEEDLHIDEVQVDKSGDWLVVKTGQQGAGAVEVQIRELATGAVEDLLDDEPDYAPGHSDNGHGLVLGQDNWNNRLTLRSLESPHELTEILAFGSDWSIANHISMRGADEGWALLSNYTVSGAESGLWRDEILQVATDGSGSVRRLLHHQSVYGDYWSTPRAVLSQDGCFVTFTSNWGDSGRTDVFVASLRE